MPVDAARVVYFTFQLIGLAVLPILTCTFLLCPSVKRHPTVPNNTFIYSMRHVLSGDRALIIILSSPFLAHQLPA
ncbi:hypothetical protein FRC12_012879, partial [Ceratobasidium sp. 428]